MTNKSKILFTSIAILLLGGVGVLYLINHRLPFGPGGEDFTKNLTGGYQLYRTSSNIIFVAPRDVWSEDDAMIPEKILRLNEQNGFIIAERQGLKRRSPGDSLDIYLIPDPNIIDYWILDTHRKNVIKNLTKERFEIMLDSLKLPKDLKLIDVYKY